MRQYKKNILVFLFLTGIAIAQSNVPYYYFSELRGMEDASGTTHLFYRMHSAFAYPSVPPAYTYSNNIVHYIPGTNTDSVFLPDYSTLPPTGTSNMVFDFTFWRHNPGLCLYAANYCHFSCALLLVTPDTTIAEYNMSPMKLSMAATNDSLLYALGQASYTSTDGGKSWAYQTYPFTPSAVSPYKVNVFYGLKNGDLVISEDTGKTISNITNSGNFSAPSFCFDKDNAHVYYTAYNNPNYVLAVSDSSGRQGTWTTVKSSVFPITVCTDTNNIRRLWLATQNTILVSDDFGKTFSPFKSIDKTIIGFHVKSGTDTIYAATKWRVYQVTRDTIITLKSLPPPPDAKEWYPLTKGMLWKYKSIWFSDDPMPYSDTSYTFREIMGDTLVSGMLYRVSKISEYTSSDTPVISWAFERYDSTTGLISELSQNSDRPILDLTLEPGDTSKVGVPYFYMVSDQKTATILNYTNLENLCHDVRVIPGAGYIYLKGVGLVSEGSEELGSGFSKSLVGFRKEGVVYGNIETSPLAVKTNSQKSLSFQLGQNYPNPFNPGTMIPYQIAKKGLVTLTVYNLLGEEVALLVNEEKPAGNYMVHFDGSRLPSGIYFISLRTGPFTAMRKIMLLK